MKTPEDPLVERLRRHRWISRRNLWLTIGVVAVVLVAILPYETWFVLAFLILLAACMVVPPAWVAERTARRPLGWSILEKWRTRRGRPSQPHGSSAAR